MFFFPSIFDYKEKERILLTEVWTMNMEYPLWSITYCLLTFPAISPVYEKFRVTIAFCSIKEY